VNEDVPTDTGDATGTTDPAELGFAAALAELERIVEELESEALDVDHLAQRVERAAMLVRWCRERIDHTRFQVTEIIERLDGGDGTGTDTAPEDGE
jgi:exodeoxyribonuclease VII small subunit